MKYLILNKVNEVADPLRMVCKQCEFKFRPNGSCQGNVRICPLRSVMSNW